MTKKLILLIDDDLLVLQSVGRLLEKAGHMVRAFQNPQEAVQEAMMEEFDLVITDIRMPVVSGTQVIRYLREIKQSQGKNIIPEIVITGYAAEYENETNQLKPHALIHKPFNLDEFMRIVNDALEK